MRLAETPRLVLTLSAAGLLSGLAIVSAYRVTLPRILANQAAALEAAVFAVVPGATRIQRLVWGDGRLAGAVGEAGAGEEAIYGGYDDAGAFVGYAIPGAGAGFQDTIKLLYGYDPERERIVGMEVLESRETPGLGDKIFKDAEFVAAFHDLAVEPPVELVKGGGAEPHQVDAITGATISAAAVVRIVRAGNETWLDRLPPASAAPPLIADGPKAAVPPGGDRGGPIPGGRGQ
jgi:Na+-translocating ferredoxin:NAD+ oxidoreductase subunit G